MKKILYLLPIVGLCANAFAISGEELLAKYRAYKNAQQEANVSEPSDWIPPR